MELEQLCRFAVDSQASDLFIKADSPPALRVHGRVVPTDLPALTTDDTKSLAHSVMSEEQIPAFEDYHELDLAFTLADVARFRCNVYIQRDTYAMVLRVVPLEIRSIEDLGLPKALDDLCKPKQGLVLVTGPTGCGKSTTLAAMIDLINSTHRTKIITIEETAELNLPHDNWVSLIARRSYGLGENQTGEVTLFDLVKTSMRHRPDVLTVGEIRGNEAYVLFQAMATGHGGMSTMHAEDIDSAVKRLTQKPMNIAPAYIPLLNLVLSVQRVHIKVEDETKAFRRVMEINEVANYEDYRRIFKWQPAKDDYLSSFDDSVMLPYISERTGLSNKDLRTEIEQRLRVLHWMREQNIRSYKDVAAVIAEYYSRPGEFYEKVAVGDLEALATVKHS